MLDTLKKMTSRKSQNLKKKLRISNCLRKGYGVKNILEIVCVLKHLLWDSKRLVVTLEVKRLGSNSIAISICKNSME